MKKPSTIAAAIILPQRALSQIGLCMAVAIWLELSANREAGHFS
jgi:hypothetical protein